MTLWIEVGVEDRDVSSHSVRSQSGQKISQLGSLQAARVGTVDGRHNGGIEDIDVHVQPVSVELGTGEPFADAADGGADTVTDDLGGADRHADRLARLFEFFVVITAAGVHDISRVEVRPQTIDVGDRRPVPPDGRGPDPRRPATHRPRSCPDDGNRGWPRTLSSSWSVWEC